jgi:predicted component of type VI protein secretion system
MGKSLMDKIQAKLELFRLEQRYTRRRHRRSTFVSNAVYVDGEYVYQTPSSTGSSSSSSRNIDALHGDKASSISSASPSPIDTPEYMPSPQPEQEQQQQHQLPQRKRLNRFSSMPGFGGGFSIKEMPKIEERRNSMSR